MIGPPETRTPAVPRAAEFFAGIGLVRRALESGGVRVVFANDIDATKKTLYVRNFGSDEFLLGDVRTVTGDDVPDIEIATASFPCVDLSLAGHRRGLAGEESGMFWEFARVLAEMERRKPSVILLENVPSFATSHGGNDLRAALKRLNGLGYSCDLFVANARWFVPQSRPRLFIVGGKCPVGSTAGSERTALRPEWLHRFIERNADVRFDLGALPLPPHRLGVLADVIERLPGDDSRWWEPERVARFVASLSEVQAQRLARLRLSERQTCATAYRRTRGGRAVWEIRADEIAGCLRTARGGSSKQAIVAAGLGEINIRWMTPREYARLQGVPDFRLDGVTANQALFGLGDAVCVPVVEWITQICVLPRLGRTSACETAARDAAVV
ncbi:MAG TPA: DNA (cytosine-5-)-methyltransferase [Gaiellaceae bacterium]